jgi:hypothetical protein
MTLDRGLRRCEASTAAAQPRVRRVMSLSSFGRHMGRLDAYIASTERMRQVAARKG